MATSQLSATGESTDANQAPVHSDNVLTRRRFNMRNMQSVLLIWPDANIDEDNNVDCQNTVSQLQRVVNSVNTFANDNQCVEFLETIDSNNNKACMIISGSLARDFVPRVHQMSQVDSIFIFCGDKQRHEEWIKDWSKIKGAFTEITTICEALKSAAQQCEHNAIPMSFMPTGDSDGTQKKLDQLDCSFMYTQILKNILLTITFQPKHVQEFLEHCREQFSHVATKLATVEDLQKDYHHQTPIWWYSCESFLYPMLNAALRLMDVDVMIEMGFFISDLNRQIDQLHKEQFPDRLSSATFSVYRGQGMSKKDFDQMKKTKGGLIAFNSFLSTSKMCNVSLKFIYRALSNTDSVGVLFVMTIDPSQSTTPFASINAVSSFQDREDEVLFSMHSVFRIRNIDSIEKNDRLYHVELTMTSDEDKDLRALTNHFDDEMQESIGWDRLGNLLLIMQQSKKAENVYQLFLEYPNNDNDRALFLP